MGYYLEVEYGMRKDVPVDVDKARKGGGGYEKVRLSIAYFISYPFIYSGSGGQHSAVFASLRRSRLFQLGRLGP